MPRWHLLRQASPGAQQQAAPLLVASLVYRRDSSLTVGVALACFNRPGAEFSKLVLFSGRWQKIAYFETQPEALSEKGVEKCADDRCAGGPWASFNCSYGFSGPLCGRCLVVFVRALFEHMRALVRGKGRESCRQRFHVSDISTRSM